MTNDGIKFNSTELLTEMSNYYPLAVQHLHCIIDNVFITEALNKNFLEAFRTGIGEDKDLGFCAANVINIPSITFFPTKKRTTYMYLTPITAP